MARALDALVTCPCCFTSLLHLGDPQRICNLKCGHVLCRECWNTICDRDPITHNAPCPVCRSKTHYDDARVVYLPQIEKPRADPDLGFGINDMRFCIRYTEPFDSAEQITAVYPCTMLKDLRFVRIATISGMTEGSMVLHANQFCATAARETLGEFDMGDSSSVVDAYHARTRDPARVLEVLAKVTAEWQPQVLKD